MALGRLVHYAIDAVLVSTVLAGIRQSSGFAVHTSTISDPTLRSLAERYLGVGETIFSMTQASAINSEYFRQESRR
ncbi:DUF1748-domain-containing protein [Pisolithus orientalis]|uniref:DUF1748-domain-containing protein n=1 Tax=Pisolithus orientalis TaxID=936130 RepID=UPI0022259161|nr:DUF1748-domain-containing protein [Pisolithus orientalis]KAI6025771.1 DUF1748-domain-containing protein [Pisolithus orientalis]